MSHQSQTNSLQRLPRHGFTLLELLLALVILTALATVVIPQIGLVLGDQQINGAAGQLRAEMHALRVKAMREGRIMMLEGMIDGGELRARPYVSLQDSIEAIDQTGSQAAMLQGAEQAAPVNNLPTDETGEAQAEKIELPENVVVESVNTVAAARSMQVEQSQAATQGQGWSRPILFYPDGVTSTGVIILKHKESGKRAIRIRGITGDVTIENAGPSK